MSKFFCRPTDNEFSATLTFIMYIMNQYIFAETSEDLLGDMLESFKIIRRRKNQSILYDHISEESMAIRYDFKPSKNSR